MTKIASWLGIVGLVVIGLAVGHRADASVTEPDECAGIVSITVNGHAVPRLRGHVEPGALMQVQLDLAGEDCVFGLQSWQASATVWEPGQVQTLYREDSVAGPGLKTLSVEVPECMFQIDLFRGEGIGTVGETATPVYGDRLIDADNGGEGECTGPETPTTTTTTTVPVVTTVPSVRAATPVAQTIPSDPVPTAVPISETLPETGWEARDWTALLLVLLLIGALLGKAGRRLARRAV